MKNNNNFFYALKRLFSEPSLVLIGGLWKSGKTDFSLFISQILLSLGIIQEVATNIDTNGHYAEISDLQSLKTWLHRNSKSKLYILDELNVHLLKRRAMSNLNVEFIKIFAEISKARAKLIGVGQELFSIDSEFQNPTWLRGIFIKKSKKKVQLTTDLLDKLYTFRNIPKTTIEFNPYILAPFTLRPPKEDMFKDEDLKKLYAWANGGTWKELFAHPNQCNRFVRRTVKKLLIQHSQIHT